VSLPGSIERSREELAAARLLADGGFVDQAISRAYYAAFHAATAALQALGETRSKHAGVVAAFERLVVRAGGIDPGAGRVLRSLFRQRQEADYGSAPAPLAEADAALAEAERLVDAIEAWLSRRMDT
jgi:uncharacterized protein (UPF0332 family)